MDVVALVAIVVAVTQVLKKIPFIASFNAIVLSIIVSAIVVAYKAIESGTPFNLALLFLFVQVVIYANGGYKLIKIIGTEPR